VALVAQVGEPGAQRLAPGDRVPSLPAVAELASALPAKLADHRRLPPKPPQASTSASWRCTDVPVGRT
jgi:hypothetical protein